MVLKKRLLEESYERGQFLAIVKHVLRPLCGQFSIDAKTYSAEALVSTNVSSVNREAIGIGTSATWHGSPDGRSDWVSVKFGTMSYTLNKDSDSEDSLGGKVSIEAKVEFKPADIDQLVAQAVVSSHIHYNRHPSQNSLLPSVGISGDGRFVVVMYDCVLDVLVHTAIMPYVDLITGDLTPLTSFFNRYSSTTDCF